MHKAECDKNTAHGTSRGQLVYGGMFTEVKETRKEAEFPDISISDKGGQKRKQAVKTLEDISHSLLQITEKLAECNKDRDEELFRFYIEKLEEEYHSLRKNLRKLNKTIPDKWDPEKGWVSQDIKACEPEEIRISSDGESYNIHLPYAMPEEEDIKRDGRDYYRLPLYEALGAYLGGVPRIHEERMTITFINHGSRSMNSYSGKKIYSHAINALADFFLTDDSPPYYSMHIYDLDDGRKGTDITIKPEGVC